MRIRGSGSRRQLLMFASGPNGIDVLAGRSMVSPIYLLRSCVYRDLEPLADAVVSVNAGSDGRLRATVAKGRQRRPTWTIRCGLQQYVDS